MHRFNEKRLLPYTPQQLFALVADIARYPEFLPWCLGARIGSRSSEGGAEVVVADLIVGTRLFRETFTSRVTLRPDAAPPVIEVAYVKGPMRHMENRWVFGPAEGGTDLEFHVAFEFRSALLEKMMGAFFDDASRRMIAAFEKRALRLYGPGARA
jgi:coenzyme Q-binding protein COQ10